MIYLKYLERGKRSMIKINEKKERRMTGKKKYDKK